MARVVFAPAVQRYVSAAPREVHASTVADALHEAIVAYPDLRGYVLDDQGRVRRHIAVFVDGMAVRDRLALSDAVRADSEVYVVQALSGG